VRGSLGCAIHFAPGRGEPDWLLAADRGGVSFTLALSAAAGRRDGWFVGLEGEGGTWLGPSEVGDDVHAALAA
jgi:hypothetical protein